MHFNKLTTLTLHKIRYIFLLCCIDRLNSQSLAAIFTYYEQNRDIMVTGTGKNLYHISNYLAFIESPR